MRHVGKKNWKIQEDLGVVEKEISVLSVTDGGCEINRVDYQCYRLDELSSSILINKWIY